jgi:hypothetical protein
MTSPHRTDPVSIGHRHWSGPEGSVIIGRDTRGTTRERVMTSGQGGQDPQQGQPPQGHPGWQTPPGQGWQNPPPPEGGWQGPQQGGWQGPQQGGWQGQPPYGYGAAPSAPGQHFSPEAPPRPDTVRFGTGAFVANLLLGLIGSAVAFGSLESIVNQELATSGVQFSEESVRSLLVVGAVIGLVFTALQAMFIFFAWKGHNWARIVLFVLGGLALVSGLVGLGQPTTGFLSALSVFQLLLLAVGIVLLARRPSNEWYRAMTARRQAGLR